MMPASVITRGLLLDLDVGTDQSGAWPVFVGFLPEAPANAICVYDTAGLMDGRIMVTGEQIEHPGIQVRVRGPGYLEVWQKANQIARLLDQQSRVLVSTTGGDRYLVHNVSRRGSVLPLGMEEAGSRRYHHFTLNATLTLTDISSEEFLTLEGEQLYVLTLSSTEPFTVQTN